MQIKDLIVDPELESFLPPLTAEERAELKSQIERDGFTDPIIVWLNHGIIVDGYNRYRIWQELGSDPDNCPDILEKKFSDKLDVMEWMFKRQNGRRNMTAGQRAAVALKMKPGIEERAEENKGGRPSKKPLTNSSKVSRAVNTRREVAKIAGVSEDTVRKTEAALKDATPETVKALESGAISANAAFKETRKPSHGTKFDPSEWEDGPERTAEAPKPPPLIRKAEALLAKVSGEFNKAAEALGPLVNAFDEIKVDNPEFAKKHRELLGHHSRLFQVCEDGKRALNALNAAWRRSRE